MNEIIATENQTFSFARFKQLLKSDLRINKPRYLKIMAATIGCFLTLAILISIFCINSINSLHSYSGLASDSIQIRYVGNYGFISFFLFSVGLTILGSMTFISMNSKSGRISTIMMPASMLEKFVLRFLIYFIGGFILLAIGFFVGCLELYLTLPSKEALWYFYDNPFDDPASMKIIKTMYTVVGLPVLLGNAFYALGSAIWPRSSWVKTWAVQQVLGILFLFLGAFGMFGYASDFINWVDHGAVGHNTLFWIYVVMLIVMIALCWLFAWWSFRNTQIVQRFMKK